MSTSPGVKPGAWFGREYFEDRSRNTNAAEFISADRYHLPSKGRFLSSVNPVQDIPFKVAFHLKRVGI